MASGKSPPYICPVYGPTNNANNRGAKKRKLHHLFKDTPVGAADSSFVAYPEFQSPWSNEKPKALKIQLPHQTDSGLGIQMPLERTQKLLQNTQKSNPDLLKFKQNQLPIWGHKLQIKRALKDHDILLLVGETGSGKSTQVPQYLIDESWCKKQTIRTGDSLVVVGGCIAITQPRRIAAITLAHRVSQEMGSPLNLSPMSHVGYSVRFDNSTTTNTKIKYVTEGILLLELLRDPWLREYSAIVLDEVHERGINIDLLFGFLRNIVAGNYAGRGGIPLKLVVMSATVDIHELRKFLSPENSDRVSPLKQDQEEAHLMAQAKKPIAKRHIIKGISPNGPKDTKRVAGTQPNPSLKFSEKFRPLYKANIKDYVIPGRQHPVQIYHSNELSFGNNIECLVRKIFQIHHEEAMPGDVLVFLPGQEVIEQVADIIGRDSAVLPSALPKMVAIPFFAAQCHGDQQNVFKPLQKSNSRKIILATNIAETSVTIPGVRYVVDTGISKIKEYRINLNLDTLLTKAISKASALQRAGRAGREAPGKCWRLYSEEKWREMDESNSPEILRCNLTQAVLAMKARGVQNIMTFPFPNPPSREALGRAMHNLYQLDAITNSGNLTSLGCMMANFPTSPSLARVLVAAAEESDWCLLAIIDIVSCLSIDHLFRNPSNEAEVLEAATARRELVRREGDHFTLLATVQSYLNEKIDRRMWAERCFVSHKAMLNVLVRS
ncbi:MAG: putative ATP-dependent RNA helicase dhr2 [Trizodia sp. TS-e1964]|nr:MAG: putative ATP-dependent RNA helicase dhr2 [Trizodia sp. TS-e1964]